MHHSSDLKARKLVLSGFRVLCHANLEVTDIFSIHKMNETRYIKSNSLVGKKKRLKKMENQKCMKSVVGKTVL
jgi:hypothetical protein